MVQPQSGGVAAYFTHALSGISRIARGGSSQRTRPVQVDSANTHSRLRTRPWVQDVNAGLGFAIGMAGG